MRTWQEAEQAGKSVGFKLVHSRDLAEDSKGANGPWLVGVVTAVMHLYVAGFNLRSKGLLPLTTWVSHVC